MLKKMVNGVEVKLTRKEEKAVREEWARQQAERQEYIDTEKYRDDRREEYPDIGEQLDAILKQLNYRKMKGDTMVSEMSLILDKWLEVKNKYPKPEA